MPSTFLQIILGWAMNIGGSLITIISGMTLLAFQDADNVADMHTIQTTAYIAIVSGLITAVTPLVIYILKWIKSERDKDREIRELRRNIMARSLRNGARLDLHADAIDRQTDAVLALIAALKRIDEEKDRVMEENRQWMLHYSQKHNIPLPPGFRARIFDRKEFDIDLGELETYLRGASTTTPKIVATVQEHVQRESIESKRSKDFEEELPPSALLEIEEGEEKK